MKLITAIQNKVAISAIGASALRSQGAAGVVDSARDYLASLDLRQFSVVREATFRGRLDRQTQALLRRLPPKGRSWGASRKALNLFLRDALYNVYLRGHFGLASAEEWYEIPLDGVVARALRRYDQERVLPRWPGVKNLKAPVSDHYQTFALGVAYGMGISRVHLDAYLWVSER